MATRCALRCLCTPVVSLYYFGFSFPPLTSTPPAHRGFCFTSEHDQSPLCVCVSVCVSLSTRRSRRCLTTSKMSTSLPARIEEVEDQVDRLQRLQEKLLSQVANLTSEHNSHAEDVRAVYQNVTTLVAATSNVTESYRALDEKVNVILSRDVQQLHQALAAQQSAYQAEFEFQVKRLLENFKSEIIAAHAESAQEARFVRERVEAFHERLVRIEEGHRLLREDHVEIANQLRHVWSGKWSQLDKEFGVFQEKMDRQITEAVEGIDQRLAADNDARSALAKDVSRLVDYVAKIKHESYTAISRLAKRSEVLAADTATAKADAAVAKAATGGGNLTATLAAFEASSERLRTLESGLRETQAELSALSSRYEDASRHTLVSQERLNESLRGVDHALKQALSETVKRLENDVDKRHKKLVESTHQAMTDMTRAYESNPAVIAALQSDLQQVRETLHHHSVAIDAQRMEGGLQSAFTELKDWLQDLERRMVSRSELEEVQNSLSGQFQSFRQHAMSTEMLLGQRLDAERAARESDASHQSIQLQKLQAVLRK